MKTESAHCPTCGARLAQPEAACLGCLMLHGFRDEETVQEARSAGRSKEGLAGNRVGAYELGRRIGTGGTAEVFLARQLEPVTREVAFKLIKPGMDSERVVARFDAERQVLARLQHPNIAMVLDAGRTPEGRPYFVLEYVDGYPITQFADQRQLDVRQRLELFGAVCQAVHHAHQRGIVHRDLKPSNILVSSSGQPKVIDFGIARALEDDLQEQTLFLTREGEFLGTPAYMSPEQARGQIAEIDTRTDVYSLGVVLYELLTGTLPFDRETFHGLGPIEAQRIVAETTVRRPSTRVTTTQVPAGAIRGDLDWIVMKALEKEKERRYDSVAALADDLCRHLANEPVTAGPPTAGYRLKKLVRRHRGLALGTAIALAALVVGASFSIWQALAATEARDEARANAEAAIEAEQRVRQESEVRQAVNDFLVNDLLGGVDLENDPNPQVTVLEMIDRAAAKTDARFGDKPAVAAAVNLVIGDAYLSLGRYEEAFQHFSRSREFNEQVLESPAYRESLRQLLRKLSIARLRQRKLAESRELLQEFIDVSLAAGIPAEELLPSRMQMASQLATEGNVMESVEMLVNLIEELTRVKGPDDPFTLQAKFNLGLNLFNVGQAAEAIPLFEAFVDGLGDFETQNRTSAMTELARAYQAVGRVTDAEKQLTEALAIQDRILSPDHPQRINTLGSLASLFDETNRIPQAIKLYRTVIEAGFQEGSQSREEAVVALHNLGLVLMQSDPAEAESLMRRAVEERTARLGPRNPATLSSQYNLALILRGQGNWKGAEEIWQTVEAGQSEVLGDGHPVTLWTTRLLAAICFESDRKDEGVARCRKLLSTPLPSHPGLADMLREQRRRTVVLVATSLQDDPEATIALLRDALEVDPEEKSIWAALGNALGSRFDANGKLADLQGAVACLLHAAGNDDERIEPLLAKWITLDPSAAELRTEADAGNLTLPAVLKRVPASDLEDLLGADSRALKVLRGE